jgi:hypothetical protein
MVKNGFSEPTLGGIVRNSSLDDFIRRGRVAAGLAGLGLLVLGFSPSGLSAPGEGIVARNLTIHPYVEARGEYDTNPDASYEDSSSDVSATVQGGANFLNLTRKSEVSLHAWALMERYQDLGDKDHEDFGDELRIRLFDPSKLMIRLNQSYADRTDFDTILGRDESRQELFASGLLGKDLTDKVMAETAYRYQEYSYDSETLYGWKEHGVEGTLGHALTRRTTGTLSLRGELQSSDRSDDDGNLGALHLGFRTRNSEKLLGYAGAGWLVYESGDTSISTPSMDIGLTWRPRDPFRLELSGLRTVIPSIQSVNNFNTTTRLTLAGHYDLARPLTLSLIGSYYRNDYEREVVIDDVTQNWADDTFVGTFRVSYHPGSLMRYFFEARAENRDSSVYYGDYSREILSIGARATY